MRWIAEQHVKEDLGGWIPSAGDWLKAIQPQPWMLRQGKLPVEVTAESLTRESPTT